MPSIIIMVIRIRGLKRVLTTIRSGAEPAVHRGKKRNPGKLKMEILPVSAKIEMQASG